MVAVLLPQFDVGELGDSAGKGGSPGAKQRLQAALAARLRGRMSPRRILLRDKLAFLLGSCQLWWVAALLLLLLSSACNLAMSYAAVVLYCCGSIQAEYCSQKAVTDCRWPLASSRVVHVQLILRLFAQAGSLLVQWSPAAMMRESLGPVEHTSRFSCVPHRQAVCRCFLLVVQVCRILARMEPQHLLQNGELQVLLAVLLAASVCVPR